MGKPVGPRFKEWDRVYQLYKSALCIEKRPPRAETGIKDGYEEREHTFPFEIFRPEKQDYLFRCSVAQGNFPLELTKKACSIYIPETFGKWVNSL